MLAWRVTISSILIPLLIGVFYLDARAGQSAPWLLAFILLLAGRSVWELTELLRGRFPRLHFPLMAVCAGAIILSGWLPHWGGVGAATLNLTPLVLCVALVLMALSAFEAARFQTPGGTTELLAVELLIVLYVGVLLALTTQLRWIAGSSAGYLLIGSLVLCTKGADVGAYFAGKRFGRHQLAPILSPKKTWEGVFGALLGGALCGWLWLHFLPPVFISGAGPCPGGLALLYGAVLSLFGMLGDLCESLLKRDVDRKDSAALFPGFGGLLDILDSVLFAGPAALLMWQLLPLATWLH
jgi:phosphatidate cytidylyltransferase